MNGEPVDALSMVVHLGVVEARAAQHKDVMAECYGGDITRERKLLEKQKEEGKERTPQHGARAISQDAFIAALRMGEAGAASAWYYCVIRHI